jgi:hypothetical protein
VQPAAILGGIHGQERCIREEENMNKGIIFTIGAFAAALILTASASADAFAAIEGTVVATAESDGAARITVRTAEGDHCLVDMPVREMRRLDIRDRGRIGVRGLALEAPRGETARVRILARVVNVDGNDYALERPIRLMERDRERLHERDRDAVQDRTRSRERDGSANGSGVRKRVSSGGR